MSNYDSTKAPICEDCDVQMIERTNRINVNVWVEEVKYKSDGETVIKFGIPSFLVSMLNDKSEHKTHYKMRMVHLVE